MSDEQLESNDKKDQISAELLSIVSDLLDNVGRQNITLHPLIEDNALYQKIQVSAILEGYLQATKPSQFIFQLANLYLKYIQEYIPKSLLRLEQQLLLSLVNSEELNVRVVDSQKLNSNELSLLEIILNSDYFQNYLMMKLSVQQQYETKGIKYEIDSCLRYFQRQQVAIISSKNEQQKVIGIVYPNKRIMVSQTIWNNKSIHLHFLLHLYYQIDIQGKIKVLQQGDQFLSEIWGNNFDPKTFSREFMRFLSNPDSWKLDQYSFSKNYQALLHPSQKYVAIVKHIEYNQILKCIISQITSILDDIILLDIYQLQSKYILDGFNYPRLHRYYSDLQYWFWLLLKIRNCTQISTRIQEIKQFNVAANCQNYLLMIFSTILQTNEYERFLIIQQLIMWIFQNDFQISVSLTSDVCLDMLICKITSKILAEEDRNLIRNIINSEAVRQSVLRINQIGNRTCTMANVNQEYKELMEFLDKTPIIRYSAFETDGLSLISGRIALNRETCYNQTNPLRSRALRIVTILHDYVNSFDILTLTPDELKFDDEEAEAGFYLEFTIFGGEMVIRNDQQASYILSEQNWSKPADQFKKEYLSLGPKNQPLQAQKSNQHRVSQFRSLSYRQDREEHQTTRCLRKVERKKYQ